MIRPSRAEAEADSRALAEFDTANPYCPNRRDVLIDGVPHVQSCCRRNIGGVPHLGDCNTDAWSTVRADLPSGWRQCAWAELACHSAVTWCRDVDLWLCVEHRALVASADAHQETRR